MTEHLFDKYSLSLAMDAGLRAVVEAVERIPEATLLGPGKADALQAIVRRNVLTAPRLRPEGKTGKRRQEDRERRDFGRTIPIKVDVVDVRIPFEGDPEMFRTNPSRTLTMLRARIEQDALVLPVYDENDSAGIDRQVSTFIAGVEQNLQSQRNDLAHFERRLTEAVNEAAERRIKAIEDRRSRDSKLSFPIE